MDIGPRCRVAYKNLLLSARSELVNVRLPEGRFIRDFPGYIFYVEKITAAIAGRDDLSNSKMGQTWKQPCARRAASSRRTR